MRFRLRTLMIVLAVVPMLCGGVVNLARVVYAARERASQMECTNKLTLGVPGYSQNP
jgi:hypothetical protein